MAQETLARRHAEFAANLRTSDIPPEVRKGALLHLVDSLGVSIAGAAEGEESGAVGRALAKKWATPEGATVYGVGSLMRPEMAALVNGSMAQALEMDDKHGSSLARPGSTVVPAVMAVAEDRNASIADALTAIVAGYETMIRLGFVARDRFLERGYHTSCLIGGFGAVAGVGRLGNHSADEIVSALGIAGTMASGIQESTRTGSTSKIIHGGWGAHSGIVAMDLASAGITGPESVYEGKMGFFQTHLTPIKGELEWDTAGAGLGSVWHLLDTAFKPYPCCQLMHAFIEAAKQILVDMARDRVDVAAIEAIHCKLAEPGLTLVTEPRERKLAPELRHEARFSLPFVVASALLYGDIGLESFSDERLSSPAIRALAARITTAEDPESDYPAHCPARMEVKVAGRTYTKHVPFHPGSPEAALSPADVLDKFARNTRWLFGNRAHDTAEALLEIPEAESVARIVTLLSEAAATSMQRA